MARIAAGERPARALAVKRDTQTGVDQTVAALLQFPSGAIAQVASSMATALHRHAIILGERGIIETDYSNHGPQGSAGGSLTLRVKPGPTRDIPFETRTTPAGDGFRLEAEAFARMVRQGPAHWNGASEAESIDTVLTLSAIARSAREGGWVEVG